MAALAHRVLVWVAGGVALSMALSAICDVLWRRAMNLRGLRMTRAEVRAEQRDQAARPEAAQRRSAWRRRRAAGGARVLVGDVVVFAPGGAWVVLRFRPGVDRAPVVCLQASASASGWLREEAARCGAAVLADAPLVLALGPVEVGTAVPERLYGRLAEVWRRVGRA